jgi:hypothetical protein
VLKTRRGKAGGDAGRGCPVRRLSQALGMGSETKAGRRAGALPEGRGDVPKRLAKITGSDFRWMSGINKHRYRTNGYEEKE